MAEFELYGFAESGNAYKAALMLELCGLEWTENFVDFFNGETRSQEFVDDVNDMGEVPVLKHGEITLTQSGVILDYIAKQTGKFGAQNDAEHRDILRWMLFDNHKFTSNLATHRFLVRFLKTGETDVTKFLLGRSIAAHKVLEKHLQNQNFVASDRPTIADISLCGYVFFDGELGVDHNDYPNIQRWKQDLKSFPNWKGPYELLTRAHQS